MTIKVSGKAIMLFVAGVGVIATAWISAKKAPEAQKKKEEALQEKRETTGDPNAQLTFVESVKAQAGTIAPVVATAAITLGSIAGVNFLSEKDISKAKKNLNEFKEMTDKLAGKETSKVIERAVEQKKEDEKKRKPWEEETEYCICFQNQYIRFNATRSFVVEAIYEINRYFHGRGRITFNEFLSFFNQGPVNEGDVRGYEAYIGETIYGYTWIDVGLKEDPDDPFTTIIYMAVYPHFFDEDDCEYEIDEGVKKLRYEYGANDGEV